MSTDLKPPTQVFLKGWGGRKYESLKTPVWQANWFRASSYFSSRPLLPLSSLTLVIGHFRVPSGPLYQDKVKASAFDMEMIFHCQPNKTPFHKKGCTCAWPHFESEGFWNSEVVYCHSALSYVSFINVGYIFIARCVILISFSLFLRCTFICICICIYTQVIIRLKNIYLCVAHFLFQL